MRDSALFQGKMNFNSVSLRRRVGILCESPEPSLDELISCLSVREDFKRRASAFHSSWAGAKTWATWRLNPEALRHSAGTGVTKRNLKHTCIS